jgi:monoamine oxidase
VAEAGGEYLDASHETMRGYADHFGLPLDDLTKLGGSLTRAIYVGRRLRDYESVAGPGVDRELRRLEVALSRYAAAIDARDPARTGAGLDTRSVADLMDELRLDSTARSLAEADVRAEYGVEADALSLLFHVSLTALTDNLDPGDIERFRIRGGSDRLPAAFAEDLGRALVLRAPVTAVRTRGDTVRVIAGGERFEADRCVVAAPLPAVRAIEFDPPLPRRARDAIASIQYGDVVKTALQYDTRFWRTEGWDGDTLTQLPIQATWEATDAQDGKAGVLMACTAGAGAAKVGAAAAPDRIRSAVDQVDTMYRGSARHFDVGASVAWGREPYSGGSYSAWAPGQYARLWPVLRRPYGRIWFAGEHTDVYASYMEGAVRSGRRVATAIAAAGA